MTPSRDAKVVLSGYDTMWHLDTLCDGRRRSCSLACEQCCSTIAWSHSKARCFWCSPLPHSLSPNSLCPRATPYFQPHVGGELHEVNEEQEYIFLMWTTSLSCVASTLDSEDTGKLLLSSCPTYSYLTIRRLWSHPNLALLLCVFHPSTKKAPWTPLSPSSITITFHGSH
jgi:hypothetical protein